MKLIDLFEAQNYDKIKDPALRWLAKFTYENIDKHPPQAYIVKLIKKYPNKAGTIYRGLNFYTEKSWQGFISKFTDNHATLTFTQVSSWSQDPTTAEQFAVTQPTYQLNPLVMNAYKTQQTRKEAISGYRGVILKMHLDANQAIDVNASRVGHENEIVVPPGTYNIEIDQILKKYEHQLQDKDIDVNQVILNTSREDLKKTSKEHSFFNYVVHHHLKDLSPQAQDHLFNLFAPTSEEQYFLYNVETLPDWITKKDQTRVTYNVPSARLFELANQGAFNDQKIKKIRTLGKRIISLALPIVQEYIATADEFQPGTLKFIGKISQDTRIETTIRNVVGNRIAELNDQVKEINKIKDPYDKSQAIEDYKNELTRLLKRVSD